MRDSTYEWPHLSEPRLHATTTDVCVALQAALDETSAMDVHPRMVKVAASSSTVLVDALTSVPCAADIGAALATIPEFRSNVAARSERLLDGLRRAYLFGERGASPASRYLTKTRPVYEFVWLTLGIKMHGAENYNAFVNGMGVDEDTTGAHISVIHECGRPASLYAASDT
ncbi:hypothetical protein GGX14DRAFT_357973 [Mycena pura]|uniref:Uncharacterized protein n=1 Tax=Mycena pura TaxID=153505 RepID=A0AAD6VMS0_9AGAR|nr:hypothetical protein GGX14DRAFT_357973 [Mycena pura]